jgi:hypothetical protein
MPSKPRIRVVVDRLFPVDREIECSPRESELSPPANSVKK